MLWHWIIFAAFVVLAIAEEFCKVKKKIIEQCCFLIICILIFLSSVRWNQVLGDWQSYYSAYNNLNIQSFSDLFRRNVWDFEPLFNTMTRIVKATIDNYVIVQFLMALINFGFFYSGVKYLYEEKNIRGKYYSLGNSEIALTFLLAWSTECMGLYTIRTSLATSICIFAIRYIERRDFRRFIIWVFIACGFHFAALVFLPAYFIYGLRLDNKHLFRILGVTIILCIIGAPKLIDMVGILGGRYAHKAAGYNYKLGDAYYEIFNFSRLFALAKALANTILIVAVCILISKRMIYRDELIHRSTGLINLYLFGAMIQVVLLPYNMNVARTAIFYINQQFFILPLANTALFKKKQNRAIFFVVLLAYSTLKLYVMLGSSNEYHLFSTIFSR